MVFWRQADSASSTGPDAGEPDPVDDFPELLPAGSRAIRAAIAGRIAAYTPDWTVGAAAADPGVALVKVFGEQAAPVVERTNRLREKYRYEQLRIAGVRGRGAGVGRVCLVVSLLDTAAASAQVPAGSQFVAPGAGGADQVVFETVRDLFATPARIGLFVVEAGTRASRVEPAEVAPASPVLAFGRRPQPGSALWFGFAGPAPYPQLAMELELALVGDAGPLPVTAGAQGATATDDPVLSWEILTADGLIPADLRLDETRGLRQSGIVEVGTSRAWVPVHHPGLPPDPPHPPLFWLRAILRHGRYETPPGLAAVWLNAVRAEGAETVRDEVLEPVEGPEPERTRQFRLARTPVLSGTVRIVVDAPDPADLFDVAPPAEPGGQLPEWVEVPTLARSKPYDRHFVLDEVTGVVTFGDGVHGAAVPVGFRHVRATSYRTGGGSATAVPASAGFVPRGTVLNLSQVDNPRPATGGEDAEPVQRLVARGPDLLRAAGSVVTAADAEVLATGAAAEVGRVLALPGIDVGGVVRPGQLTLLVVGVRRDDDRPPVPTSETLRAVADLVADARRPLAALGTTVVVRPARFVTVALEPTIRLGADADGPAVVRAVVAAVNAYLDPATGGDDGRGWPLGGAVRYQRLVAVIAGVAGLASVPRLGILVAGRAGRPCQDAPIPPYALPWPGYHLVLPLSGAEGRRR